MLLLLFLLSYRTFFPFLSGKIYVGTVYFFLVFLFSLRAEPIGAEGGFRVKLHTESTHWASVHSSILLLCLLIIIHQQNRLINTNQSMMSLSAGDLHLLLLEGPLQLLHLFLLSHGQFQNVKMATTHVVPLEIQNS